MTPLKEIPIILALILGITFALSPVMWAFQKWDCMFFPHDSFCVVHK